MESGVSCIKALISIVSIFPVGSLVKINNGEVGRVDPSGRRLVEARTLKLADEPMLYIVDPAIDEVVLKTG